MWSYLSFEMKHFFRNKKNIAIYVLLCFTALFYALKIAPTYDPIEEVDIAEMEARYFTREEFLERMQGRDLNILHPAVIEAYYIFNEVNPIEKARIDALKANNLQAYATATSEWYFYTNSFTYRNANFAYNALYFTKVNPFASEDAFYNYLEQTVRYDAYANADYELTLEKFEQRTALQTVERLLKSYLPYVLIICSLLLTIDIISKDRRHRSLLKGIPLADWKKLLIKFFVALLGSITLLLPLLVGFIIIGFQDGFGHFSLPSPVYDAEMDWHVDGIFEMMTLGTFLAQSFILLIAWYCVFITIVLLCSIVFRAEIVSLATGILLIFGEKFYASRGVGYFWQIERYPTSYIEIGNVVSKYRNFFYVSDGLHFMLGVKLLLASAAVLLTITLLISYHKRFKLIS